MQKHLDDLAAPAGLAPEWKDLLRDLDRLQQVRIRHRGADWLVRTDASPAVTALFRHAQHRPAVARQARPPPPQAPPPKSAAKRRGRPRRSATASSNFARIARNIKPLAKQVFKSGHSEPLGEGLFPTRPARN